MAPEPDSQERAAGKNARATVWAAIIAAIAAIVVAIVARQQTKSGPPAPQPLAGIVRDGCTRLPIGDATVQLKSSAGLTLAQDHTDQGGSFRVQPQTREGEVILAASAPGYIPYEMRTPVAALRPEIVLKRMAMSFGISPAVTLGQVVPLIGQRLNVSIAIPEVKCQRAARTTKMDGAEIQGDACDAAVTIRSILARVRTSAVGYEVATVEMGKRYEITCY